MWQHVDVAKPQLVPGEIHPPAWDRWVHQPSGLELYRWLSGRYDVRCEAIWPRTVDGQAPLPLDVPNGTSPEAAQQAAIALASEAASVLAAKLDDVRRALR